MSSATKSGVAPAAAEIALRAGDFRGRTGRFVHGCDQCADFEPLGVERRRLQPEQCHLHCRLRGDHRTGWPWGIARRSSSICSGRSNKGSMCGFRPRASTLAAWLSRTNNARVNSMIAMLRGTVRSLGTSGVKNVGTWRSAPRPRRSRCGLGSRCGARSWTLRSAPRPRRSAPRRDQPGGGRCSAAPGEQVRDTTRVQRAVGEIGDPATRRREETDPTACGGSFTGSGGVAERKTPAAARVGGSGSSASWSRLGAGEVPRGTSSRTPPLS